MASKYVNLEAAAAQLNIPTEELNRLRESGQIRGFSDRGTWKFKAEDVEALARTLPSDSNAEMPRLDEAEDDYFTLDDDLDLAGGSQIVLEEEMGDQPTVISKKSPGFPPNSDSDVRLVIDPSLESESGVSLRGDSATRQPTPPQTPLRATSEDDSNVSLNEPNEGWSSISDSDVRLAPLDDAGSDITLAADSGIDAAGRGSVGSSVTDSELKLVSDDDLPGVGSGIIGAGSDITLMPDDEDSSPRLMDVEEDEESVLSEGPGSGLAFSPGDSGISLDLAMDSGISLDMGGEDSALMGPDSGISLVPDSGIGLTLDDRYERDEEEIGGATIPMMGTIGDDDENDTSFDMPLLEDSGAEIDSPGDTTGVVMFDDDEDSAADTMEFDSAELSDDEFVDFDNDDADSYDELSDGDLDVSDDMLDDDVLEADDDAFEDDFESGESVSALPVPGGMRGAGAVPVAAEWDMLSFSLVVVSTLFMGICTLLMYDLVRTMWGYETPLGVNGMILDTLQGIIKS